MCLIYRDNVWVGPSDAGLLSPSKRLPPSFLYTLCLFLSMTLHDVLLPLHLNTHVEHHCIHSENPTIYDALYNLHDTHTQPMRTRQKHRADWLSLTLDTFEILQEVSIFTNGVCVDARAQLYIPGTASRHLYFRKAFPRAGGVSPVYTLIVPSAATWEHTHTHVRAPHTYSTPLAPVFRKGSRLITLAFSLTLLFIASIVRLT